MPSFVETMNSKGEVLASYTLPPLPPSVKHPPRSTLIAQRMQSPAFFFGEMVYRKVGAMLGSRRLHDALRDQFGRDREKTRGIAVTIVVIASLLAMVTLWWAHRALVPRGQATRWAFAVFILGPAGLLLFWLAGERPRTVPCRSCGGRRRIDEGQCPQCASGWPENPRGETAIFERGPLSEAL